jgi:Fe-S-cluster-containing hydrogenase component 2
VIAIAKAALKLAASFTQTDDERHPHALPWLMVSLNDGEDPHFRKAEFDATACPPACTRPCELICPADAIVFASALSSTMAPGRGAGVVSDRCYGCGRCVPICPVQQIETRSYQSTPAAMVPALLQDGIDAIEIHTQIGHMDEFCRLWAAIEPWVHTLKLIAISCPDGESLLDYLWALYDHIAPLPCPLVWQLDGRPMSGDIGVGATRAAVKLGQKVVQAGLPGYIQLAGGTNHHTVPKLRALNLLHPQSLNASTTVLPLSDQPLVAPRQFHEAADDGVASYVAGVAYGSYARTLLMPILNQLDAIGLAVAEPAARALAMAQARSSGATIHSSLQPSLSSTAERSRSIGLEEAPDLLWEAVGLARSLVSQLKTFDTRQRTRLDL